MTAYSAPAPARLGHHTAYHGGVKSRSPTVFQLDTASHPAHHANAPARAKPAPHHGRPRVRWPMPGMIDSTAATRRRTSHRRRAWGSAAFGWSFTPLAYAFQHVEQSFESRK